MRIIQTCGSRSWGGLEMQTLKIAAALSGRGHEVSIICPPDTVLQQRAERCFLDVQPLLFGDRHFAGDLKRMTRCIRSVRPDVVHTHLSHDMWTIVPAMNLAGSHARYLLTKRMGSSVIKKDFLHCMLYKRLDAVIAISEIIHRDVLETCPVPPEKVHTLINGADLNVFNPGRIDRAAERTNLGVKPDEILTGLIGRFSPGKGHREFLRAARIILDRSGQSCKFLIAGDVSFGEKEYEKELNELIGTLDFGDRLIRSGFRKDVEKLYAALDILAFPSYDESLGNVLLEGMAMNLPVVGSNSGSVPELVTDGENGLLVPPGMHEPLAEKLLMLIRNPDERARMGAAGRKRVQANYSFEHYMERLEVFYGFR